MFAINKENNAYLCRVILLVKVSNKPWRLLVLKGISLQQARLLPFIELLYTFSINLKEGTSYKRNSKIAIKGTKGNH